MIEKQHINGKDVWIKVDALHVHRDNPHLIPTEYFTVAYYLNEPTENATNGEIIKNDNGESKLFESPVAALSYVAKKLKDDLLKS
jgi:hypothetical protein